MCPAFHSLHRTHGGGKIFKTGTYGKVNWEALDYLDIETAETEPVSWSNMEGLFCQLNNGEFLNLKSDLLSFSASDQAAW